MAALAFVVSVASLQHQGLASESLGLEDKNGMQDSPFGNLFGALRQAGQAFLSSGDHDKANPDANANRYRSKKVKAMTKEHKKGEDTQIKKASVMVEERTSKGKTSVGNRYDDSASHTATQPVKRMLDSTMDHVHRMRPNYHHAKASQSHDEIEELPAKLVSQGQNQIEKPSIVNVTRAEPTRRTCEYFDRGCKSMCRWLKLSEKELNEAQPSMKCPMVERPLASCGYVPRELRAANFHGALTEVDCAVALLRANVLLEDVGNYVDQLDDCMIGISPQVNTTCRMGLELLKGEVIIWRQDEILKAKARNLELRLRGANQQAQQALDFKTHQQDAIDLLARLLAEAEDLPGHYLAEKVHKSRILLDRLAPIPAVRAELREAMAMGEQAMADQSMFRMGEASVWLGSVIPKAQHLDIGPTVQEGQAFLQQLNGLRSAMQALKLSTFSANISLNTKSNVAESISILNQSIASARQSGVTIGLRKSKTLVGNLVGLETAIEAAVDATRLGDMILKTPHQKSSRNLRGAADRLNTTISRSQLLGLSSHESTANAVQTLDSIAYVMNARHALYLAIKHGERVIAANGSSLSDDEEELAISELEPALNWGNDVGLDNGLPYARELEAKLRAIEGAKEQMAQALATGNASYTAKAREDEGIRALAAAVAAETQVNITGGADDAQELLRLLATRKVSRSALETAVAMAIESLRTRSNENKAIIALNVSIQEARASGLDEAVIVASAQLKQLQNFAEARHDLGLALRRTTPAPAAPEVVQVIDTVASGVFNRTGYKVVHLPAVPGAADDGDDDFDEHIQVLVNAIGESKDRGEVDPDQQKQLARLQTMQETYLNLQDAIIAGNSSLTSKAGVSEGVASLTAVIREADNIGLALGVDSAKGLLRKLKEIKPARDELDAAILQANVSMHTFSGMDLALMRLNTAIATCEELHLDSWIPKGEQIRDALMESRSAFSVLKAAIMQGEIALKHERGEEAAIKEIEQAIELADKLKMHKQLEVAVVLLHELTHMNAEHQQLQAAMNPDPSN